MKEKQAKAAVPTELLAEQLGDLLLSGGVLGDVYDYSEQDYEVLYALGHSLYSQCRYDDASKAFGFLVMHNHLERRYLSAFASSLQMTKNYQEALAYYSLASVMDLSDPIPSFHSAECLVALNRTQEAMKFLAIVVRQCENPKNEALKARAEALNELIESANKEA